MKATRWRIWLGVSILLLVSLACGVSSQGSDPAMEQTVQALALESTRQAMAMQATLAVMQAGQAPASPTQAANPPPAPATEAPPPTEVPAPTEALPPTEAAPTEDTSSVQATAAADEMYQELKRMVEGYYLRSAEGVYYPFPDLEKNWYDHKNYEIDALNAVDHDLTNFVMKATVTWKIPGVIEKIERTGCGFSYGYTDDEHLHTTFLGVDGVVHTLRERGSENIEMKGGKYNGGLSRISDSAEIMLVVERQNMIFFVNEVEAVRFRDPYIDSGKVGLATLTGSPTGIQCKFSNAAVWELK